MPPRIPLDPSGFLVTVDSGVRRCGLAVFHNGYLELAGEPQVELESEMAEMLVMVANHVVSLVVRSAVTDVRVRWYCEAPQSYGGRSEVEHDLGRMRRVIEVIDGHRSDAGPRLVQVRPKAWKGNVPKPVHHRRIWEALTPLEASVLERLNRTRDALDAVGLGLYLLGRTKRGGGRITQS